MSVNVSATVTGGSAPYSLTVCFGTVDHSGSARTCPPTLAGWSGASPARFNHTYLSPGNYSLTGVVTDAHGSMAGATALVVVVPLSPLTVSARLANTSGPAPLNVSLTPIVGGGTPPYSVAIAYGDGTVGSAIVGETTRHLYRTAGAFHPILTVNDSAGHSVVAILPEVQVAAHAGAAFLPATGVPSELVFPFATGAVLAAALTAFVLLRHRRRRLAAEGPAFLNEMLLEADDRTGAERSRRP